MMKANRGLAAVVLVGAGALVLSACGRNNSSETNNSSGGGDAKKGGTIYYLNEGEQFSAVDPQVAYTGEELAFLSGYLFRSLTAYKFSADPKEATTIVPDLATDTGKSEDGAKKWSFTLKDGVTFEDGSPVQCKDIAYGTSRAFDTELAGTGPQYSVQFLDIPSDADGTSKYKGPFKKTGQDLYDKAVTCSSDQKTITFNLKQAVPDFNYTVTLGFFPVPQAKDTGVKYDDKPVSSGPYKIQTYNKGKGGKMVLVRNDKWDPKSDDYRPAYPDQIEVDFGTEGSVIDQRMLKDSGNDQQAVMYTLQPENLAAIFSDPKYKDRRTNELDPYVRYTAINTKKVTNLKIRQAILAAVDRQALRTNAGGDFAGDLADGYIKPNLGKDYAPTGLWDTLLGQPIPPQGDPEFAKKLIAESGEAAPTLVLDVSDTATNRKAAAIYQSSLGKAGFTVKLNVIESGKYNAIVYKADHNSDLIPAGWAPDWPNASTVIPPLTTPTGCCNLSKFDDPTYLTGVQAASVELDRDKQATLWQDLNKQSMLAGTAIPTRFNKDQRLWGSKVGPVYLWAAYGSIPYGALYVKQ